MRWRTPLRTPVPRSTTAWRRRVAALVVGVALVATAASPGAAAPAAPSSGSGAGIPEPVEAELLRNLQHVQSDASPEDSTSPKTAIATCPSGTVVVGTGFQMAWNTGEELVTRVVPTETTVSVTAHEDETGEVDDWSITAFAACAARPDDYRIVRSEGSESSVGLRSQRAYCPHGTVPLGLGWVVSKGAGGEVTVTEARTLPGASVTISAAEDDTAYADDWSLEATAICADVDGFEVVSDTEATPGTYDIHHAYCSDGKLPVSAGFTVGLNRNVVVSHFYAYPDQDYSYVIAKEDEDGSPTTWTFTVDVVCVTPAPTFPLQENHR